MSQYNIISVSQLDGNIIELEIDKKVKRIESVYLEDKSGIIKDRHRILKFTLNGKFIDINIKDVPNYGKYNFYIKIDNSIFILGNRIKKVNDLKKWIIKDSDILTVITGNLKRIQKSIKRIVISDIVVKNNSIRFEFPDIKIDDILMKNGNYFEKLKFNVIGNILTIDTSDVFLFDNKYHQIYLKSGEEVYGLYSPEFYLIHEENRRFRLKANLFACFSPKAYLMIKVIDSNINTLLLDNIKLKNNKIYGDYLQNSLLSIGYVKYKGYVSRNNVEVEIDVELKSQGIILILSDNLIKKLDLGFEYDVRIVCIDLFGNIDNYNIEILTKQENNKINSEFTKFCISKIYEREISVNGYFNVTIKTGIVMNNEAFFGFSEDVKIVSVHQSYRENKEVYNPLNFRKEDNLWIIDISEYNKCMDMYLSDLEIKLVNSKNLYSDLTVCIDDLYSYLEGEI